MSSQSVFWLVVAVLWLGFLVIGLAITVPKALREDRERAAKKQREEAAAAERERERKRDARHGSSSSRDDHTPTWDRSAPSMEENYIHDSYPDGSYESNGPFG